MRVPVRCGASHSIECTIAPKFLTSGHRLVDARSPPPKLTPTPSQVGDWSKGPAVHLICRLRASTILLADKLHDTDRALSGTECPLDEISAINSQLQQPELPAGATRSNAIFEKEASASAASLRDIRSTSRTILP